MVTTITREAGSHELQVEEAARLFKALGHPLRVRLVCGLLNEPKTQSQISRMLNIPQSSLAQHLAVLRRTGIVEGTRDKGAELYLKVVDDRIPGIFSQVCSSSREEMNFSWD